MSASLEEKMGACIAKIDHLCETMQTHIKDEEADRKDVHDRLKSIENDLVVRHAVLKFFKYLFASIVFIVTFKFGDIASLWRNW